MTNMLPAESGDTVTLEFLQDFADAWNRHDLDSLMSMMSPGCLFQSSAGPHAEAKAYSGQTEVRQAFGDVFRAFPDAMWSEPVHFISGNRGVSEWLFTGNGANGEVRQLGCDVFTFAEGKISVKNTFRKNQS